jgi:hypothetical protein
MKFSSSRNKLSFVGKILLICAVIDSDAFVVSSAAAVASDSAAAAAAAAAAVNDSTATSARMEKKEERNKRATREFFQKIDESKDGQLDAEELQKYVSEYIGGFEFDTNTELSEASTDVIKTMDTFDDDDETISTHEFGKFMEMNENVATVREVKLWVKYSLRFPQYAQRFEENAITIEDFPSLISNDGNLLKKHLQIENELHRQSIARNLKRQLLHLGKTPSVVQKVIAKVTNKKEGVVSVKWSEPEIRGTPPAHLFVVKSMIVTPGAIASGKEWKIEEVVEWGEENSLIVRNCPKGATIKFKVIAYGAFGASKAATTNEVKIPTSSSSTLSSVAEFIGNSNINTDQNSALKNASLNNYFGGEKTFLSFVWSALAIIASSGGVAVRLYYLVKSWKKRNDYKNLSNEDENLSNNASLINSDDVNIDATAAVGIVHKSPQKAVTALIKRAEKQLLDSSRDLMEIEPPSPKDATNNIAKILTPTSSAKKNIKKTKDASNGKDGVDFDDFDDDDDERKKMEVQQPTSNKTTSSLSPAAASGSLYDSKVTGTSLAKPRRNASSSSLSGGETKPSAINKAEATPTKQKMKKGICADSFCSKKVKGMFKTANTHYCGFCQHKFCFEHVASSPHGTRGKCMPESECVCTKCFAALDDKRKRLLLRTDVLKKADIVESLERREKAAKRWKLVKNVVAVSRMAEKRMEYTRQQQQQQQQRD